MGRAKEAGGKEDVERYLGRFKGEIGRRLRKLRGALRKTAPQAEERLSYGVPAFFHGKVLILYAGFKDHIGFYPTPSLIEEFSDDLKGYPTSKGTVRFPTSAPFPYGLACRMLKRRLEEESLKKG